MALLSTMTAPVTGRVLTGCQKSVHSSFDRCPEGRGVAQGLTLRRASGSFPEPSTARRKSSKNLIVTSLFRMERMPMALKTKSVSCLLEMARNNDVAVSYTQHCTVVKGSWAQTESSSHLRGMTRTSAREQKERNKEKNPSKHTPKLFLPHSIIHITLQLHWSEITADLAIHQSFHKLLSSSLVLVCLQVTQIHFALEGACKSQQEFWPLLL